MITSSHKLDSLQAINHGLGLNPFENAVSFLIVVVAILLAAYCIYRFDLVAGSSDSSVSVPASVGTAVPVDVRGKSI